MHLTHTNPLSRSTFVEKNKKKRKKKKKKKGTRINDCLLHWRLMIHWCLSVLALKVEKSFDDGGLRLTDKSWMPPSSPSNTTLLHPRCSPSLTLLSYVLHCYRYGNPLLFYFIFGTEKFKLHAEEPCTQSRLPLPPSLLVCLPRLPFVSVPLALRLDLFITQNALL